MSLIEFSSIDYFDVILKDSHVKPQYIFKHSHRCIISRMALKKISNTELFSNIHVHIVDVLKDREVSNEISERLNILHHSPQLIVILNGQTVYHASHESIELLKFT